MYGRCHAEAGPFLDDPLPSAHLRIALVVPPSFDIPPAGYGGIEWMCHWLADGLAARGHDVVVIGSGDRRGAGRFVATGATPDPRRLGEPLTEVLHLAAAARAAAAIGYVGAGTIELLLDPSGKLRFMEMNTRIQVEHCVTEEVINFDLIKEQLKIAMGERISGKDYIPQGHAIECRINAEDPANGFRPSPGKITNMHFPGGHGIRIDSHVYSGYTIPPNYDSMVGKLICHADDRAGCIARTARALREFAVGPIKTTIPLQLRLMEQSDFRAGGGAPSFYQQYFEPAVMAACGRGFVSAREVPPPLDDFLLSLCFCDGCARRMARSQKRSTSRWEM